MKKNKNKKGNKQHNANQQPEVCYIFDFDKKVKNGKKYITKEDFIAQFNKRTKSKEK